MQKTRLALLFFIFLFLFISTPAYAIYPIQLNVTSSIAFYNLLGLRCINSTSDNAIYCYINYQMSNGNNYITRYNASLGGAVTCQLNYTSLTPIFNVLNETHAYNGGSGACDLWNITNIASGTCTFLTRSSSASSCKSSYINIGDYDTSTGYIYFPTGITNFSWSSMATPYWSYPSSSTSTPFYGRHGAIDLVNGISYLTDYNQGTGAQLGYTYKYESGVLTTILPNVTTLFGFGEDDTYSSYINSGNGTTYLYAVEKHGTSFFLYKINFSLNASDECDNTTGFSTGTSCDQNDPTHLGYVTNKNNCHLSIGNCPTGTVCSQLTPQINVTTSLVENYTSCQIRTVLGFSVRCTNLCGFGDTPIWSNCLSADCKHCTINNGDYDGFNVNTWYSNQATVSVPWYTIACINTTSGNATLIIDNKGNSTDEVTLLTQAGNIVTEVPSGSGETPPTSTSCESNVGGQSALAIGSLMGITDCGLSQTLIAMIVSIAIGFALLFYTRNDGHGGQAFIFGTLISLVMFTVIGWFYSWLMVIIIVIGGYIVAKQLGFGGG